MSKWEEVCESDIEIDGNDINIMLESDNDGSRYVVVKKQDMINKLKSESNAVLAEMRARFTEKLFMEFCAEFVRTDKDTGCTTMENCNPDAYFNWFRNRLSEHFS